MSDESPDGASQSQNPDAGSMSPDIKKTLLGHSKKLASLYDETPNIKNVGALMKDVSLNYEKKRLFVCCDGTWNNASGAVSPMTNVAKLARAVDRIGLDDFQIPTSATGQFVSLGKRQRYGIVRQIVHYSPGVGTQSSLAVDSLFSGALGKGIDVNILSAYCFLCNNYSEQSHLDEIILVGFSRGAFTVRCLAQFIDDVGLLRPVALVFLRSIYRSWKEGARGDKAKTKFKHELAALRDLRMVPIRIKVLAEWDTVSALRSLRPWKTRLSFVNDKVPKNVDHAFHAVALHEKRMSFNPMMWKKTANGQTKVEQCAFVGCHSDVGGGNADPGLSTLSLVWMISQIQNACGAKFDHEALLQFITPFPVPLFHKTACGPPRWPLTKPVMCLHNLANTEGRVKESRKGLWLLPHYLSLGFLDGNRAAILDLPTEPRHSNPEQQHSEGPEIEHNVGLNIHFSTRLLFTRRRSDPHLKCRLFGEFQPNEPNEESRKWVNLTSTAMISEASINETEKELLKKWIKIARLSSESIQMLRVAKNVKWGDIQRKLEAQGWGDVVNKNAGSESLIGLVRDEFRRLRLYRDNDETQPT